MSTNGLDFDDYTSKWAAAPNDSDDVNSTTSTADDSDEAKTGDL